MAIARVALIFDDRLRPDTTGVYVRRALAGLVEAVHFLPEQAESIPAAGFDLYLSIDDDTEHRLPDRLRPRAYWAIDTHRDFPARFQRAVPCDVVFAAQRDGAARLRAAGIDSAGWLPLACDPAIHRQHDVPKQLDVAFVGHACPGPRDGLLDLIRHAFPQHFLGRAYFDEMARIYSASRVVFNRSLGNDVNMRVFEATACGSLVVTNDLADNGQAELFTDGVHLVTYREPGEMVEKIGYYLAHAEQREAIAAAGRAEAVARHTYRHRLERLLGAVEARLGRAVVAGAGVGPDGGVGRSAPNADPGDGDAQPGGTDQAGTLTSRGGVRGSSADPPDPSPALRAPSPRSAGRGGQTPHSPCGHPLAAPMVEASLQLLRADPSPALRAPSPRSAGRGGENDRTGPAAHRTALGGAGGRAAPHVVPGLSSIIVPCCNQREFTQLCFQALFRCTRPAWELIVINNGSTDETAAYLAGVQDGSRVPVTVITNGHNRGFPAAINQGLQVASGESLVLLNNDAVVTEGWLDHLMALAAAPLELAAEESRPTVEAAEKTLGGEVRNSPSLPPLIEIVPL